MDGFTGSSSLNWICNNMEVITHSSQCPTHPLDSLTLIRWHSGGNISVNTSCSFQTGAYEFFFTLDFPCRMNMEYTGIYSVSR